MLAEFETIVSQARSASQEGLENELRSAARALLERQFIFSDDHHGHRRFELIRRHRSYFFSLFDALGFDLRIDEREQVAGIISQAGAAQRRMSLNETLFLIALRVVFEERKKEFMLDELGRCQSTLAQIWTLVEERSKRERPSMARCRQIAETFARNGLVRIGDALPGGDAEIEIRPVIALAATTETAEALERYALPRGADGDTKADDTAETDASDAEVSHAGADEEADETDADRDFETEAAI